MAVAARHQLIALDWSHDLEAKRIIGFLEHGEPFLRIPPEGLFPTQMQSWLFHPFNPHQKRFDNIIRTLNEAGLLEPLKSKALKQLKEKTEFHHDDHHHEHGLKLCLNEYVGTFTILGCGLFAAFLAMIGERHLHDHNNNE